MFPKIEVELMGFHAAAQPHIYEIMKHCPTLPITVNFNGGVKCVIQNIDAPPNPAPPQCPECSPLPWALNDLIPGRREILDANFRWVAMAVTPEVAAFIIAAANAAAQAQEKEGKP